MSDYIFEKIVTVDQEYLSAFRALRLRGLQEHPEAFGETAEGFRAKSDAEILARIETQTAIGGCILAALSRSGEMLGAVGLAVNNEEKVRHRAMLWGMYVIPECRGQGVGRRLIEELLLRAEKLPGVQQIHLAVVTSNDSAFTLYKRMGFSTYGTDPRVLKIGDRAFDEYLMFRPLGGRTG